MSRIEELGVPEMETEPGMQGQDLPWESTVDARSEGESKNPEVAGGVSNPS